MKKLKSLILFALVISSPIFTQTLHLYGGQDHDVYLGCLNCNSFDINSIWNEFGTYGSKYNSKSIWNEFGTYGNEYNIYSPWNEYSLTPPVVVDKDGNFYGYFTVKKYKTKRADFELALTLYEYHEFIEKNVFKMV